MLSEDERLIDEAARDFCEGELFPGITLAHRHEKFDRNIMNKFGDNGFLGSTIPEIYGGAGLSYVNYGLIAKNVESIDSGYRSAMSVQSSLVMHPIYAFGTESQKLKYLPDLASGKNIGAFGLTEPDHGSDHQACKQPLQRPLEGIPSMAQRCGSLTPQLRMYSSFGPRNPDK